MKLDQVRLYHLSMPLKTAFETSFGRIQRRECILVEVQAGGISGWGEAAADHDPGYSYETTGTAWHILHDFLIPAVLNSGSTRVEDYIHLSKSVRGHHLAKAGLEMALWDLRGKLEGVSLRDLLGGTRTRAEVGVSVGLQEDPQALVKTAAGYVENGYRRVKIKIKPGRDVEDARAVRAAFPDLPLQVDANSAYDLNSVRGLQPLDELGLLLIEQPLAEDDLWDHHQIANLFSTPICLDESITSARHARQALEMKACRIINIKAGRLGGLSEALQVHNLCKEARVPVWCGGMLETGVGRASNLALAALPNFTLPGDISATERYYNEDITAESFQLNPDSTIDVPSGPGLGIEVQLEKVQKYALRQAKLVPSS
jgi:o-succinylbenzoate synthase